MASTAQQPKIQQMEVGEPVWEIAKLYPMQGHWDESDYLALETNHLVEFSHGVVEFLPTPTPKHQFVLDYLYEQLKRFVRERDLGTTLFSALRVRLWPGKYREPDILFVLKQNYWRFGEKFCDGADLVAEIVSGSGSDRERDLVKKRREYAEAGIAEYWIVDPREETTTVLALEQGAYREHGVFHRGEIATSLLLTGFEVDATPVLDADVPGQD